MVHAGFTSRWKCVQRNEIQPSNSVHFGGILLATKNFPQNEILENNLIFQPLRLLLCLELTILLIKCKQNYMRCTGAQSLETSRVYMHQTMQ